MTQLLFEHIMILFYMPHVIQTESSPAFISPVIELMPEALNIV